MVPEAVIHDLEPVEVDEKNGDSSSMAGRLKQRLRQPIEQEKPVGQVRQRVVEGQVLHAGLRQTTSRDVLQLIEEPSSLSPFVDFGNADLHPGLLCVAAPHLPIHTLP